MESAKFWNTYEADMLVWLGQGTRLDQFTNLQSANSIRISSILIGVMRVHESISVRHYLVPDRKGNVIRQRFRRNGGRF